MKKKIILPLVGGFLISYAGFSQNVGIGTTTPGAKLEVKNSLNSTVKISSSSFNDTSQIILSNRNAGNAGTDFVIQSVREAGLLFSSVSDLAINTNDSMLLIHPTGRVGIGGPAVTSAILNIQSTDKGVLVPRMTSVQRAGIISPVAGLLVFDTTTGSFWFFTATGGWSELSSGNSPGTEIVDSDGDTKVQTQKTVDDDTIRFVSKNFEIARMTSKGLHMDTAGSVYIGNLAGQNDGGIDDIGNAFTGNVGIGRWAGQFNVQGSNNVFVGYGAGRYEQGKWNTYIGYNAGNGVLLGTNFSNTFIGRYAGGSASGNDNIHIGIYAGAYNNGSDNIFIGNSAGGGAFVGGDNGTNNIYLGHNAGPTNISTSSNNIFIGNGVAASDTRNNRLYIHNGPADTSTALLFGKFDSAYLRVNGDLKVTEEVHTPLRTGLSNMIPICYGNVSSTGGINIGGGSGNFTVAKLTTGWYGITINGESYQFQSYATVVTPITGTTARMAGTGSGGGDLHVRIWDATGAAVDEGFHFVVFKR